MIVPKMMMNKTAEKEGKVQLPSNAHGGWTILKQMPPINMPHPTTIFEPHLERSS